VYDPLVGAAELHKLGLRPVSDPFEPYKPDGPNKPNYDAVVLAVSHQVFRQKELETYLGLLRKDGTRVLVDVKGVLPREAMEHAGILYWSL